MAMRREVRDWLNEHQAPAIQIVDGDSDSSSWFGGNPAVPSGFQWPTLRGESIPFLGQIRLADLPVVEGTPDLPRTGTVAFFFHTEGGVSSSVDTEKGFQVVYWNHESDLSEMAPPGVLPGPAAPPVKGWRKLLGLGPKPSERRSYDRKPIAFRPMVTYSDSVPDDLLDTDDEIEFEKVVYDNFKDGPLHHLFGYAQPVQSTSEEMAAEVAKPPLDSDGAKWVLLLQVDEDRSTGFNWIDAGKVFFWITEQDLSNANFNRVRAIIDWG